MKVVLVGPVHPFRGGIAHYTTLFSQELLARGHETQLISFSRQYPAWLYPGTSDVDPSTNPFTAHDPKYWIDTLNPITWGLTFWRMWRFRPDVIIFQWWTTFLAPLWIVLGILCRLISGSPLVFICHNVFPHESREWDKWLAWLTLRWGSNFVVQSVAEEERLRQIISKANITVVPMPAFHMFNGNVIDRATARDTLGIAHDSNVMLFFGIVRAYKGLDLLLDAMPKVSLVVDNLCLQIAGEFWEDKEMYRRQIEQLGLTDKVSVSDRYIPNEEIAIYFSAADVLVAPYRYVTGSAVAQIALSFGLPILPDNIVPKTEFIEDGSSRCFNNLLDNDSDPEHPMSGNETEFDADILANELIQFFTTSHRCCSKANVQTRYANGQFNDDDHSSLTGAGQHAEDRWQYLAEVIESTVLSGQ